MTAPDRRAEVIAGLRELADFLVANPQVPVSRYGGADMLVYSEYEDGASYTGDAARHRVDEIAALLGVQPKDDGHYKAIKEFAGGTEYRIVHIPDEARAQHDAEQSYRHNIRAAS